MNTITKSRFLNIDALRGIAAFLVVLFHLIGNGGLFLNNSLSEKLSFSNLVYFIPAYGYVGVYLFFVISGFCIHLRWAKSYSKGNENPNIDFFAFWKRRWLRLYPAYLAAIALFLGLEYYQGILVINSFFVWDLISHLLMIHNIDNHTVYSMNGVFWTLAIEEQLYLLYFLLLYLRKQWGWMRTLVICFISRFVWLGFILVFNRLNIIEVPFTEGALANWWIWALGAIAVENYLGIIKLPRWCHSMILSIVFLLSAAILHYLGSAVPVVAFYVRLMWVFEPFLWGFGFFLLINYVMQFEGRKDLPTWTYKVISLWAGIGIFSYSLYLTHEFILGIFAGFNNLLIIIFTIIFAYLFFLIFEKPFMKYLSKEK